MQLAIETRGLSRHFGAQRGVEDLNLHVPERAVYGFLGENGAGKTTAIRLLLGLLKPSAGSARIFGANVAVERLRAARSVGAMVEAPAHYTHLTGRENLEVTRRLLKLPLSEVDRVLELVALTRDAGRLVGGYSLGMRQRLGVARALLGRPRLLVLDEPTNGLDPNGIVDMRRLIAALPEREGVTVLVSSHVLAEVEQVASHVGLMHRGKLVLQAPAAELKRGRVPIVRIRAEQPERLCALLTSAGIAAAPAERGWVRVADTCAVQAAARMPEINFMIVEAGLRISGIEVREPSLEEIFVDAMNADAPARRAA